jgi:PAS domain S-box-containing protein
MNSPLDIYGSLFNGVPVALAITEMDGTFVDVNETYCLWHGFSREEIIGITPVEAGILSAEEETAIRNSFVSNNNILLNFEITYYTKERTKRNALLSANPIKLQDKDYFLITVNDITGQKKAEQKLQESAEYLKRITDNVPGMVFEYLLMADGVMQLVFVSKGAEDLIGFTPEELMKEFSLMEIHPEDYDALIMATIHSANQFSIWEQEYRIKHRNGTYKWVHGRSAPYRKNEAGDVWWIGTLSDVNERKEMEEAKKRSEQRLHQTIELTPNLAIQWYNRKGEITFWNPASEKMYGFTKEEALGKTLDQLIYTKEDAAVFLEYLRDLETSGRAVEPYETQVGHKSGESKTVLATTFVIPGDNDESTFVCMDFDISVQKRLELESKKASALHKAILDSAGYPVIAVDHKGIITHFNRAAERMLGYSSEEMVGIQTPLIIHDKDEVMIRSEELSRELSRPVKPGLEAYTIRSVLGLPNEHECTYVRKDGSRFPVLLSVTAMRDDKNEIFGFLGVAADLTERRDAEEKLKKKNEELIKINTELDRFVYSASHDLRAPVTSMLGLIDIAKLEKDPSQLTMYLDKQKKTMIKMDEFIHEIVNYSRNGRLTVAYELLDMCVVVEDIFEQYNYLEKASRIKKTVTVELSAPFFSDKQRINVILSNLISNSIKYADLWKETPFLDVRVVVNDVEAVIKISDNGEGIKSEYKSKVFDMFYRATLNSNGSGLGLYIVKEVIEKLHGSIELQSEYGKGTQFTIRIPNGLLNSY